MSEKRRKENRRIERKETKSTEMTKNERKLKK